MSRQIHRYGWKPSLPGVLVKAADTTGLAVKPEVDPRAAMPPVFDQGQLGSCTANATAAAFQYDQWLDGHKIGALSRLWIYWQERSIEGSLSQGDCGAMGSDAFIAASTVGVPAETDWPYVISKFNPKTPPAKATKDAKSHYLLHKPTHLVPQAETAIKQVLSNQQTIAFGFTVYESFEEDWPTPHMPIPEPHEQVLGGHEVLLCGYLESDPKYAIVRNSWGSSWQDGGYFLFPWAELLKRSVCSDFRTIVRAAA